MKNKIQWALVTLTISLAIFSFSKKPTSSPDILPIIQSQIIKTASGFGMRTHPVTKEKKMHQGVDFVLKEGSPVIATADGKVILVERLTTGRGNNITIEHANHVKTSYCHLKDIEVVLNQTISQKDIIGTVGSSGQSTGPHLHYEIEVNGKYIDPTSFYSN